MHRCRHTVLICAFTALGWSAVGHHPALALGEIPVAAGGPAAAFRAAADAIKIKRYKKTFLSAFTEYNTSTCEQISKGSWTLERPKPKFGTVSYGTVSGQLGNGACPGKTFTFAAIYYTWERHSNESITDRIDARWKTPDGQFDIPNSFPVKVRVVRPVSETTAFSGWDADGLGLWRQKLQPPADDPGFDFSFDTVREADPGGGGPDTCWFTKSAILPFTAITGGTWFPDEAGVWEFDHVGWFTTSVKYYRKKNRAPCGTTFPQQMQHKAQPEKGFVNYGPVNTLGGSFTNTTVTTRRAGKSRTVTR